jgi:hypothetical protein
MGADFEIRFPSQDVRALFAQMERAQNELNVSNAQALRQAGNAVAKAVGASTVLPTRDVKAKKRAVEKVGGKSRYGNQRFRVTSWKNGRRSEFTVTARNLSAAKRLPQVMIGKYGLAKRVWVAIARKLGSPGSDGGATKTAKRLGDKFGDVDASLKGADPYVIMTNSLPYAREALSDGERSIDTAMARASRALRHSIDNQIARRMGAR